MRIHRSYASRHAGEKGAPSKPGIKHLGNPVETSIAELAKSIIDLTGSRSRIVYRPLPIDDPIQRCPDISQASALLDWKPRTQLRVGLQRTIAYFDRLLVENGETS